MTTIRPEELDLLAARGLDDSARWFPDLHDRGPLGLVVHFALGLSGELGELVEVLDGIDYEKPYPPELAPELADCAIYALDLVAALGLVVELRTPGELYQDRQLEAEGRWPALVIAAGQTVNLVKKLNRGDRFDAAKTEDLEGFAGLLLAELVELSIALGLDLPEEISAKRDLLNLRWGA